MKKVEYLFLRIIVFCFKICPYFCLYIISDFFYIIIYYFISYRKKVVRDNLEQSFKNKTKSELKQIEKQFYKHLCDTTIETIKGFSVKKEKILKRYHVVNPELANKYFNNNQDVIFLASHYGNWEYGILAMPYYLKHKLVSLYMPMSNKYTEKYGVMVRQRFGMNMVKVQDTKSVFENRDTTPIGVIMAADQSPSNIERSIWINFLNRKTACLHGPEAYSKKTGMPLLYFSINKTKRGYYSVTIESLIDDPINEKPEEITKKYMQRLEQDIINKPQFWLWSHRRWKHKSN